MKLKCKSMGSLCELDEFIINEIGADYQDFGDKQDESPDTAEEYGCGDMRFTKKDCSKDILNKYKISEEEYNEICEKLREELSFGDCGWCV